LLHSESVCRFGRIARKLLNGALEGNICKNSEYLLGGVHNQLRPFF
jgi:hypothetical protein